MNDYTSDEKEILSAIVAKGKNGKFWYWEGADYIEPRNKNYDIIIDTLEEKGLIKPIKVRGAPNGSYYRATNKGKREGEIMTKGREGYVSRISPVTGVRWVWFGGHGIHGYVGRREVAFFNTGNFSKDSMSREEAKEAVERAAHMTAEEQSDYAADEHEMKLIRAGQYRKPWLTEEEHKRLRS